MTYQLHQLLEASADRHADRPALVDRDRVMTYAELNSAANRVANLLVELGVRPGDRVGLYLQKSQEAIVGLYGILKTGAAYVPIDPNAPAMSRATYIIDNCGISVVVTGEEMADKWVEIVSAETALTHLVVMNAAAMDVDAPGVKVIGQDAIEAQPATFGDAGGIGQDLAYILYTSGSTGAPKGVKLSHLNGFSYVRWLVDYFEASEHDRFSNHPPLHFDMSIPDIFGAAMVGAALVLVPPKTSVFPIQIKRFIENNEITIWYSVPSTLSMLLQRGKLEAGCMPTLRVLTFAGEVFPSKYLADLMRVVPHPRYINQYGPTETNVCTYYEVPEPPDPATDIPIGRAIADVETFVVTEDGARVPPGEVGELLVRGSTVMRGYWGDPDKTARRLVPNPLGVELPDLVYRTGDLVREDGRGDYIFLGRRDNQIKSRGYRIELGEIETALYAHDRIKECAVLAVPDDIFTNKILAYVVLEGDLEEQELKAHCKEKLPPYMIPDFFRVAEGLPKTSTGKIDRRLLADEIEKDEEQA
ncbi:MAG: amino acid adenylation domain-containing protein [Acidimicrobiia bacterium]|nr:amino acid adenylation domain-containing protein [Acidimicrobiia bacterium]